MQEFSVFTSRNYSESFARQYYEATRLLLKSTRSGVRTGTVVRTLIQVPARSCRGDAHVPERAMIQSYILTDAFKSLYSRHKPAFATLHLNNVAYMQHRYGAPPSLPAFATSSASPTSASSRPWRSARHTSSGSPTGSSAA